MWSSMKPGMWRLNCAEVSLYLYKFGTVQNYLTVTQNSSPHRKKKQKCNFVNKT